MQQLTPFVILLNGTSSAGKSSIAVQIQKLTKDPILHVGFDLFTLMLPPSYLIDGEHADLGFRLTQESPFKTIIKMGPIAEKLNYAKHRSIKAMLDNGFSLILDEILFRKKDFEDYLELFKDYRVLFVGVKPPLEVAEQREKARGDRVIGLARGLYDLIHLDKTYDLTIDSAKNTPEESAKIILECLNTHPQSKAFKAF